MSQVARILTSDKGSRTNQNFLNYKIMKKSVKKMQLKKRSISTLNANVVKGGLPGTTTFISVVCPTRIYIGEDICFTQQQR